MNKVFLIGNLTRDPELTTTSSGISVCRFSIAVNRRFGGESKEVDFLNITAWRAIGETCGKYLHKGSKVAVAGSIQTRSYEANDGSKRYAFDIIADEVEFLTAKGDVQSSDDASSPVGNANKSGLKPILDEDLPF